MKESKQSNPKLGKYLKVSPKSDNTISTGKLGNQVTSFELSPPCMLHLSEPVTHFCQNCQFKPLCGFCLQEGSHKNHSVKNIEKASKIVQRVLTETLITIRAKVNLLQVLADHIQSRQNQIRNQFKDYMITINESFDSLEDCLLAKRKKSIGIIQQFYKIQCEQLQQAERSAQQQNDKLSQMIAILSEKGQKLEASSLCIFYYQKKDILQGTIEEGNCIYQDIKKLVPELKWSLDPELFEQLKLQINYFDLKFSSSEIQFVNNSFIECKKKSVGKSKQKLFFKQNKHSKISYNGSGFWTPKNHIQSAKQLGNYAKFSKNKLKQMKDSKKLLTLISSDSPEKVFVKQPQTPSTLVRKGKHKLKFDKNS